jgi:tellurite resistance protein TerB
MPKNRSKRPSSRLNAAELRSQLEDADISVVEGVVAGCALVAYADGWVTPEETRRMRGLILRFEPATALGAAAAVQMFEEITLEFASDHDAGENRALQLVSRLADQPHHSELLIDTCCAIAEADGGLDAEEREMILKLCVLLGVDPKQHGL